MNQDTQAFIDALNEEEWTICDGPLPTVLSDLVGCAHSIIGVSGRTFVLELIATEIKP